jgi:hypothetical protein
LLARNSGVAFLPARILAGSPGANLSSAKAIRLTPRIVGIACSKRRTMNENIVSGWFGVAPGATRNRSTAQDSDLSGSAHSREETGGGDVISAPRIHLRNYTAGLFVSMPIRAKCATPIASYWKLTTCGDTMRAYP